MLVKLKAIGNSSTKRHMGFKIKTGERAKCKSMYNSIINAGRDAYVDKGDRDADGQRNVRDTDVPECYSDADDGIGVVKQMVREPTPSGYKLWEDENWQKFKDNHPDKRPEDVGADLWKGVPQVDKARYRKEAEQLKNDAGMVPRPTRFFLNPTEQEDVANRYFVALRFQSDGHRHKKWGEHLQLVQTCATVVQPVLISMIALMSKQIKDPDDARTAAFAFNMG